jgi:V-type H+-transporting ATPase subunit G
LPDLILLITAKAERLRQAKAEAEKEIAAYRAEREGAYQKKLAEVRATCSA